MFAEYCCEVPLNPYWLYCPFCGKKTNTKRSIEDNQSDELIAQMRERHEGL